MQIPLGRLIQFVMAAFLTLGAATVPASAVIVSNRYTSGDLWVCPNVPIVHGRGLALLHGCYQAPFGETQVTFGGYNYAGVRAYLYNAANPYDDYLCEPLMPVSPEFWLDPNSTLLFGDVGCAAFDSSGTQLGGAGQNRF